MSVSFKCPRYSNVGTTQPLPIELHLRPIAFDRVNRDATTIHGRECSSNPVVNVRFTPRIDKLAARLCLVGGHRALHVVDHTRAMFLHRLRQIAQSAACHASDRNDQSIPAGNLRCRLKSLAIRSREAVWPLLSRRRRPNAPVRAPSRYPRGSNDRHRDARYRRGYVFARFRVRRSR